MAVHSMRIAPLRTVLTAAGIVIGIMATLCLVAFISGLRQGFDTTFGDLSRAVFITKTAPKLPGTAAVPLRESDMQALANSAVAPQIDASTLTPLRNGSAVIRYGGRTFKGLLGGTSPGYLPVRNRALAAGRMFTPEEDRAKARVLVLGSQLVDVLFDGDADKALGAKVTVGRIPMTVIGVLKSAGQDQDTLNITPLNAVRDVFAGLDTLNGIGFMARSADEVPAAVEEAFVIIDPKHKIRTAGARDYVAQTNVAQLRKIQTYLSLITWFTLTVASIALLIGGLGVANIMLVTVTERTSEIGLRKAIGARKSAILRQFLIESVMLAGVGGLVGVGLGVAAVTMGGRYLPRLIRGLDTPQVSWPLAVTAFTVSLAIGLLAGLYPAYRAGRMNPIDALRY